MRKAYKTGGFLLLDCLFALLVVSLVIGGCLFTVSQYADERAALRVRLEARTVAWNRLMEQYQLVQRWGEPNRGLAEANGTSQGAGRSWYWEMDATSTIAQDFYRYEVRVFETDPDNAESGGDLATLLVAYYIAEQ